MWNESIIEQICSLMNSFQFLCEAKQKQSPWAIRQYTTELYAARLALGLHFWKQWLAETNISVFLPELDELLVEKRMPLQKPGRIRLLWEMEVQGVTTLGFVFSSALPALTSQDKYYFTSVMSSNYSPPSGLRISLDTRWQCLPTPLPVYQRAKPFCYMTLNSDAHNTSGSVPLSRRHSYRYQDSPFSFVKASDLERKKFAATYTPFLFFWSFWYTVFILHVWWFEYHCSDRHIISLLKSVSITLSTSNWS